MQIKPLFLNLIAFLFVFTVFPVNGQEKDKTTNPLEPAKSFVSSHQTTNGGKQIKYTANASETYLKDASGEPVASIWSVAYTQDGLSDTTKRPVTFVFNGGPGSASVWLHMGMFGPEIVKIPSDANKDDGSAPYKTEENDLGVLDLTDLVFIDPVGTGYSRVIGKGETKDYYGLMEDANSVAKFIRQWITENNRWNSPKYIAGESYGTVRAATVANVLEGDGQNMAMNGIILISQCLDYAGSTSMHDNITSYITYLPSMAATAWYHKKAGEGLELDDFIEASRNFTYNQYIPALYRGSLLSSSEKNEIAERLTYFTGLNKEYILKSNLRILMPRFQKELLRDKGLAVGRLDGRFMGDEIDAYAEGPHLGDPSDYQISAAFTAALNHYYATTLKVKMDRPYVTSNDEIGNEWRFRPVSDKSYWEPSFLNVARKLAETQRRNPEMKVLVASGYFDLICPFFDAEYTFARNGIDRSNVTMTYYESGHMMYTHEPDRVKLANDIRTFFTH